MKWYKKYLSIYEKEYKDIPIETGEGNNCLY